MCRDAWGGCCAPTDEACGIAHLTGYNPVDLLAAAPQEPYRSVPQDLADDMASACQGAVAWFHGPETPFWGDPTVRRISDSEVSHRIEGYQAELDREGDRVRRLESGLDSITQNPSGPETLTYQLSELPFARQRALVERWERLWVDWLAAHPGWVVTEEGFVRALEQGHEEQRRQAGTED